MGRPYNLIKMIFIYTKDLFCQKLNSKYLQQKIPKLVDGFHLLHIDFFSLHHHSGMPVKLLPDA